MRHFQPSGWFSRKEYSTFNGQGAESVCCILVSEQAKIFQGRAVGGGADFVHASLHGKVNSANYHTMKALGLIGELSPKALGHFGGGSSTVLAEGLSEVGA